MILKLLKRYLPSAIIAYFISMGFLYFMQDVLIFPGAYTVKGYVKKHDHLKNGIESVSFTTKDGTKLDGAFIDNKSDSLVVYFGGNAENVKSFINIISKIKSHDFISFNYRGFGKSKGEPNEQNIYSDALEIYNHFKKGYKNISIIGRSLGTAVATYTADGKKIDNLILITPFDSISNIAQNRYMIFPIKLLIKHPFDSQKHIKNVTAPVSILMAEDDRVVPNSNTLKLKKDIKNLKLFQVEKNTDHHKIIKNKEMIAFISEALK